MKFTKKKILSNKNTYIHVVAILLKYYGYGEHKRFETKKQLKIKAKEIWNTLKIGLESAIVLKSIDVYKENKVTIANVKKLLGKREKKHPPIILPPDWDKIRNYFELDLLLNEIFKDYPIGVTFESKNILGKTKEGEIVKLKAKTKYDYDEIFAPFVDWVNVNINILRQSETVFIKLKQIDKKINKKGEFRFEIIPCTKFGDDAYVEYLPPNTALGEITKEDKVIFETIVEGKQIEKIKEEPETKEPIKGIESEIIKQKQLELEIEKEKTKAEKEKQKTLKMKFEQIQTLLKQGFSKEEIIKLLGE